MKHRLLLTLGLLTTPLSFGQTYFSKQEIQQELSTCNKRELRFVPILQR